MSKCRQKPITYEQGEKLGDYYFFDNKYMNLNKVYFQ